MREFRKLLRRFGTDERGVFAVIFAILAIVLVATAGAVVDFTTVQQARARAQDALDSAALGLHPRLFDTPTPSSDSLKATAQALLVERLADTNVAASVDNVFMDKAEGELRLEASIVVPMSFVSLVGVNDMSASVVAEVRRGSVNVEVAVALDTTGSMLGQKIVDLQEATAELIDIVVQDQQTPTYSKMALVPYSMGVNVGGYATAVRGAVRAGRPITGAAWAVANSSRGISGATKSNPAQITTSNNHDYSTGDIVWISGVSGMTQLNNRSYVITKVDATKFTLNGVNSTNYSNYSSSSSDTVTKCQATGCAVVITSTSHGFANGAYTYITGVGGMTQINNNGHLVANSTANSFVLSGTVGPNYSNYTSGGSAFCTTHINQPADGCEYYRYQSPTGQWNINRISTCVTERTGASTDVAPSVTYLGRNYPTSSNPCINTPIVPLSSDKTALKATASALTAGGSTAGAIGISWAWYMVSPNFGYLWPSGSQPAPYGTPNTIKAVILMTDGEFNSVYCNGVLARNSISGSGSTALHNNCDSPNGSPYAQALAHCAAIKAAGVVVYTVGFDIVNQANAQTLMQTCATDAGHAYLATTGADLTEAFKDIGRKISLLRLSR